MLSGAAHQAVQVGRAENVIFQRVPEVPAVARGVPFAVPSASRGFVNRVREMHLLRTATDDPSDVPRIVVCSGLRGVGKSAMVRQFAHRSRARFPGGQLYIDYAALRHRGGASVGDAVASCLRDLGVAEEFLPGDLDARMRLFRTATAATPVLVVLDDVGEPQQVRALLPNCPGSVVVATSDEHLSELLLDGADLVEVARLSPDDGVELLTAICGSERLHDRRVAEQLVELCAGLPVALQVVAARLRTDATVTLEAMLAELVDERRRLSALTLAGRPVVSAVFHAVYRALPAGQAELYRMLGAHPGPDVTVPAVAALAGVSVDSARVGLKGLIERGLVESAGDGRYRFHSLVRLHARDLARDLVRGAGGDGGPADTEEVDHGVRRVVEFYLAQAVLADHAVMGERTRYTPGPQAREVPGTMPFPASELALAWLEAERANLMAAQRTASERGWLDLVWQFAETMTALFFNHRHLADWLESGTAGAQAAAELRMPAVEARLWLLTSRAMTGLGERTRAGVALDRAVELAQALGDEALLGSVWEFRGRHSEGEDPEAAVDAYRRSIVFNRRAGQRRGQALAELFLAGALTALAAGEARAEAVELYEQSRAVFVELGDARMAARAQLGLAGAQAAAGRTVPAIELLNEAVSAFAERRLFHYEAEALEHLAGLYEQVNRPDLTRSCLVRAAEILRLFGSGRAEQVQHRADVLDVDPGHHGDAARSGGAAD
ncbi:MAG: hypothetical protein QG671_621 [Actinomycetota bacterium]|nr:hypothetical protein [Actinomycetota bacterium]